MSTQPKPSNRSVTPSKPGGFTPPKGPSKIGPASFDAKPNRAQRREPLQRRQENTPQARVQTNLQSVTELAYVKKQLADTKTQLAKAQADLEAERLRLVACSEAATSNTEATMAKRMGEGDPYYSASYSDVCDAVDEQVRLRTVVQELEAKIAKLTGEPLDEKQSQSIRPEIRAIING